MKSVRNYLKWGMNLQFPRSAAAAGLKACWFFVCTFSLLVPLGAAPDENQNQEGNLDAISDQKPSWKFQAGLSTTVVHDDNIFILPEDEKGDWYAQIAPMFFIGKGNFRSELKAFAPIPRFLIGTREDELPWKNFFYAGYTPEFVVFSKYHDEDAVNHDFRLAGRRESVLWSCRGQFHFQHELIPNIDVGRRIKQTFYTAEGSAVYQITGKLAGGLGILGKRTEYSGGHDSTDGRASAYIDYQVAPKTLMGLRVSGGYLDTTSGYDQTYEQALLQIKFQPGGKLSFAGQFGGELRQYDSDLDDRTHFVFDVSSNYQATDGLLVTLDVNRKTTASAEYSDENIVATTYAASIRQRLLLRYYLKLTGGFVRNEYENSQIAVALERRDDYSFYRASLAREFTRHGTIELFYEHRENDSSLSAFKFAGNLAGLSAAFLF